MARRKKADHYALPPDVEARDKEIAAYYNSRAKEFYPRGAPTMSQARKPLSRDETNRLIREARASTKLQRENRLRGKTAHVGAGHANGGQFTGGSNAPRRKRKPPSTESRMKRIADKMGPKWFEYPNMAPLESPKTANSGKTAHVSAGHANGGQFTGRSNAPSGSVKPKPQRKPPSESQKVRAADRRAARKAADKAHEEAMAPFLPPKDEQFYPRRFDPAQLTYGADGELDSYGVARMYGKRNLRKYYKGITAATMREHARNIMARNPGTKPKSMSRKDDLVEYIVAHTPDSGDRPPKAAPATRPLPAPKPRAQPRKAQKQVVNPDYHREVEYDLMRALQIADDAERDGSWTHQEANKARGVARRMATIEHKKVAGWEAATKPAPKPRTKRAEVPSGAMAARQASGMSAEEWNRAQKIAHKSGRMPTRMNRVADAYPKTGKRTRRTKAQATVEYLDARGAYAQYRRSRG